MSHQVYRPIDSSIGRYIGRYSTDISTYTRSGINRYSIEYQPMYRPIYRPIHRSRSPIRYMIQKYNNHHSGSPLFPSFLFLYFLPIFPQSSHKISEIHPVYFQVPLVSFHLDFLYFIFLPSNIIKAPSDEKYRRVKSQNKSFLSKVWRLPEAQEFLHHWGWIEVCCRQ